MDLLCVPDDPAILTEPTSYVCKENWDGGAFLTYAQRKGRLRLVPPRLRSNVGTDTNLDEPYTELLYPAPRDEVESFCQTWLFFGLLCEVFGLNDSPTEWPIVDRAQADREIAELHMESIIEEGGVRYLSGQRIYRTALLILERSPRELDFPRRVEHLATCLAFASNLLQSFQPPFDQTIKFSVAALGEQLTNLIRKAVSGIPTEGPQPILGYPWYRGYLAAGSELEELMLGMGWCISEVEKIRTLYQGLNTRHFLSRLKRLPPHRDHSSCSRDNCKAFQLDPATYHAAHVVDDCPCEQIEVDIDAVRDILVRTSTFPILRVNIGDGDLKNPTISVEERRPNIPYVAFSHVWADGLGNPTANSLPRCQVARIAGLVRKLQLKTERGNSQDGEARDYRIWVDPLCCPIEPATKKISLQRIADVYREATHVLVLDKSISGFVSEGKHPAELLLRAVGCSPWMRRLWTLQGKFAVPADRSRLIEATEGALAQSVYFNFSDHQLDGVQLLKQLFQEGLKDGRYMQIWHDIYREMDSLHAFRDARANEGQGNDVPWTAPNLSTLQRSLYFRTVSVPSDEALCISTLMSLDPKYIIEVDGAEERMARVWELLDQQFDGLPLRMIFYNDDPLSLLGFRWAPRSFLGTMQGDSVLTIDEKSLRFTWGNGQSERQRDVPQVVGRVTRMGLKAKAPGGLLRPRPLLPGLPLHPWAGLIKANEDQIYLRQEPSGKWFRVIDWYRSMKLDVWTRAEREAYDSEANNMLCCAVDQGNSTLLYDVESPAAAGSIACRMASVANTPHAPEGSIVDDWTAEYHVHGERTVILFPLGLSDSLVADVLRNLAGRAAEETLSHGLILTDSLSDEERVSEGEELRGLMRKLMAEAWSSRPDFVEAVGETIGPDMEEYFWAAIPKFCSHDIELVELGSDTTWIID